MDSVSNPAMISRTPNEILSCVFELGLPTSHDRDRYTDTRLEEYRVLIGSVCKLWREVSHSTPHLLGRQRVISACSKEVYDFRERMLRKASERSKNANNYVALIFRRGETFDRLHFGPRLISPAHDLVLRARHIAIQLGNKDYVDAISSFFPLPSAPQLTSYLSEDWPLRPFCNYSSTCFDPNNNPLPSLTAVSITSRHCSLRASEIDRSQLQSLSLCKCGDISPMLGVVQNAPNLCRLRIPIANANPDHLQSDYITHLDLCSNLTVNSYRHAEPLTFGSLPNVQHLNLSCQSETHAIEWPHMPCLQSLVLDVCSA